MWVGFGSRCGSTPTLKESDAYPDALLSAIECAKAGDGEQAVEWLRRLLARYPEFDIRIAKRNPWIGGCEHPALREFLVPRYVHVVNRGSYLNNIQIENVSAFRLTEVEVSVDISRRGSTETETVVLELDSLMPGKSHAWVGVFQDSGWFGWKLRGCGFG